MNHTLEHFIEFLDNPDVYDNYEYRQMLNKWIEYVLANEQTVNIHGEEWRERRERMEKQLDKRFGNPQEIQQEFDAIHQRFQDIDLYDDDEKIRLFRENIAFLKKNQLIYDLSELDIEAAEQGLDNCLKSIEARRVAEEKVRQAKIAEEDAFAELEEAILKEYQRTGKMPIVNISPPVKKYSGN